MSADSPPRTRPDPGLPWRTDAWRAPTDQGPPPGQGPGARPLVAPGSPPAPPRPPRRWGTTRLPGGTTRPVLVLAGLGGTVVAFVLWLVVFGTLTHARDQRALLDQLGAVVVAGPQAPPEGAAIRPPLEPRAPVALLEVPAIGLEEVVVEGTSSSALTSGPGHVRSSALPGELGNVVLAGRRTTFGAPFARIGDLEEGDAVFATSEYGRYRYEVAVVVDVAPGEVDGLSEAGDARITLMTSEPALVASRRLVAVATLDGAAIPPTRDRPRAVGDEEIGLGGEPVAIAVLAAWVEVLVLALVARGRLRRAGWSPRSVRLVSVPILVALVLLCFESLQRLLPATL